MQRIYLISIGGAVMHNMAMALHLQGNQVSGSDDEIFEPARSRLAKYGLLPGKTGWDASRITPDIDVVILGMHARADNPELVRAQELGLKIYSFPEYVYEQSRNKTRVVIGGSHGKTTTTSMIMHALQYRGMAFDYLVGSIVQGFETMVQLSNAPIMIIEGDEYLSSPVDRRPKFHLYHPHMAVLTGIAWDHINVFPTFDNYLEQFRIFINQLPDGAPLAYDAGDEEIEALAASHASRLRLMPYQPLEASVTHGKTSVIWNGKAYPVGVFGRHNLLNLHAAMLMCRELGMAETDFLEAMQHFTGAGKRLEVLKETADMVVFRDFAHSPSKLKATIEAVKQQYPERKLVACYELHTFSSLSRRFLSEYANTMNQADVRIVYFNRHVFEWKKMPVLDVEEVSEGFGDGIEVITETEELKARLASMDWHNANLLLMSSGTFDNLQLDFLE